MSQPTDAWYVRFPDGRVLRAANTHMLRRYLGAGRIPTASTVRRSADEEWVMLEWMQEFADLARPPRDGEQRPVKPPPKRRRRRLPRPDQPVGVGARLDPRRLRLLGVGDFLRELLVALDSALAPRKLILAAGAGLALGALLAAARLPQLELGDATIWLRLGLTAAAVLLAAALGGMLTRMTFVEVSRLKRARWRHAAGGLSFRLLLGQLLLPGIVVLGLAALRWYAAWLPPTPDAPGPAAREVGAQVLTAAAIVLEFILWPLLGLLLLLTPILVVEECSLWRGLRLWGGLLRQHFASVVVYEMLAAAVGAALALPFFVPLWWGESVPADERVRLTASCTRGVLLGLLAGLPLAYLFVANVFIYLNVRYETRSASR